MGVPYKEFQSQSAVLSTFVKMFVLSYCAVGDWPQTVVSTMQKGLQTMATDSTHQLQVIIALNIQSTWYCDISAVIQNSFAMITEIRSSVEESIN
jgi:hypothetical protein